MIGQTISHYKILEKLGEGGMGVVYKAEDLTLKRTVALKFLPPHVSASETDRARFLLEAQAAAALNHPNICTIYGIEETDGHSFIAMEFVDGQTLREKRASINLAKAIEIGIQIADGLAIAHEKGIVHRDIKPENIMVRKDGIVQIMDFGLAKLRASRASRLTKEGSTVGTAGFMAPEQVQGQETDHRSDIFSLGVLLYELFTGELPFKGVHETALLYEIVNVDPAPPSAVKPELDPELDRIVLECLQKDPDERYQGVKDISKDLKRFKRESSKQRASRTIPAQQFSRSGAAAVAPPAPPRIRLLWPVVAAVLAVAVVFLGWELWRGSDTSRTSAMRIPINLPLGTPLVNGSATLAISPDGSHIVYLASAGGVSKLFLRSFDQFDAVPMPGTEQASDPFFSRDGEWIGFFRQGRLMKASIHGGSPIQICAYDSYPRGAWWSSDDYIWFGKINQVIYRVPAGGGDPVPVTTMDTTNREISHRFPCVLPDNKTVVFTVKQNNISSFDDAIIAAENIETHQRTTLVRGGTFGRYTPAGYLLYSRGESIFAVGMDPSSLKLSGNPLAVLDGGMPNPFSGTANFDIADNGTVVYTPNGPTPERYQRLQWFKPGGSTEPVLDTLRAYGRLNISPDGERLAMNIRAANDDIWIYHMTRRSLTRLTFGGGNSDLPVWTPDGKEVLFAKEVGTKFVYFLKPWDGSGAERRVGSDLAVDPLTPPSFSPDGRWLAYPSNGDIWVLPMEGDQKPELLIHTPASESWPQFSPDGRYVAYASNESGRNEIYVVPFPKGEGKWQVSTTGGVGPTWTADGKSLLYGSGTTVMRTDVTLRPQFDFGTSREYMHLPSTWNNQTIDFLPNGSKAIVSLQSVEAPGATQVNVVIGWLGELKQKLIH